MVDIRIGVYKGHPTFEVREEKEDKYPVFAVGMRKAEIINNSMEEIAQKLSLFVKSDGESLLEE